MTTDVEDFPEARLMTADYWKNGSSIVFRGHSTNPVPMLNSRSSPLLLSRAAAFPAYTVDSSEIMTKETIARKKCHQEILRANTSAFRRRCQPEGTAEILAQKHRNRDFIQDMHILKDTKDLDKSKTYTFSIKPEIEFFNEGKPLDDFVRPENPLSPRSTGYDHGHLRSMLKFDAFGPQSSAIAEIGRERGVLPMSPNIDRYRILNTRQDKTVRRLTSSGAASSTRSGSVNTSRTRSTAPSTNSDVLPVLRGHSRELVHFHQTGEALQRDRKSLSRSGLSGGSHYRCRTGDSAHLHSHQAHGNGDRDGDGEHMHTLFHQSSASASQLMAATTGSTLDGSAGGAGGGRLGTANTRSGLSTASGALGYHGRAVSVEDRVFGGDPYVTRTLWHKSYSRRKKDEQENKQLRAKISREVRHRMAVAEEERKRIAEFEDHMVLAKLSV